MTDTLPPSVLDAAREAVGLAEQATPGPWQHYPDDHNGQAVVGSDDSELATLWHHCVGSIEKEMRRNAALIAHAGTHYGSIAAALLAAHERERELTAELTRAIADLRGGEDTGDDLVGLSLVRISGEEWQDEFAEWYKPEQWPLGMHRAMGTFLWGKFDAYRKEIAALTAEVARLRAPHPDDEGRQGARLDGA